ncbi:MAG: DNA-directed RNA polymerase subunit alpha [Mycoplasmatales bacterium]|nr:DNA-directed RNA polymerase subunit alpha [Mycoplasmatales bacterium]
MDKFEKLNYTEIETKKVSDFETSFAIAPLERGFANTLGNAVRRVLLSSVPGVAPFAVKTAGVDHEFQTISGIKEDAVQLIINLKKVRFVFNQEVFQDGEVIKVYLKESDKVVTANDLVLPPGVEVVNKNIVIANVTKTGSLELELYLTSGRGFIPFDENKDRIKSLSAKMETKINSGSFIAMDSDFSPVVNVSYESVELNTSAATIQEKLTLNIKTDGSLEAKEAVAWAAHILLSHLNILSDIANITKDEIFQENIDISDEKSTESVLISSLDLSVRSYNCLKRANFITLDQLSEITMEELVNIKNLGRKSVDEIVAKLSEYDIKLKEGE